MGLEISGGDFFLALHVICAFAVECGVVSFVVFLGWIADLVE